SASVCDGCMKDAHRWHLIGPPHQVDNDESPLQLIFLFARFKILESWVVQGFTSFVLRRHIEDAVPPRPTPGLKACSTDTLRPSCVPLNPELALISLIKTFSDFTASNFCQILSALGFAHGSHQRNEVPNGRHGFNQGPRGHPQQDRRRC